MLTTKKEQEIWQNGTQYIACVDEVGRGCILGSVVAAAVIMPKESIIEGINDSKKLSAKKREFLYYEINKQAVAIGVGIVEVPIIDSINIKNASQLAMKKAVENLETPQKQKIQPEYILIDAEKIALDIPQEAIIKGDATCYGIAAASIVAKVYRDRLCKEWDSIYPGYEIHKNKGYATKDHIQALVEKGPTPIHRTTFIQGILLREQQKQLELFS